MSETKPGPKPVPSRALSDPETRAGTSQAGSSGAQRAGSPDAGGRREELIQALVNGEKRFYQLPADLDPREAADIRRRALERISGTPLDHVGHYSMDAGRASSRHCENFIGAAQIPLGVVGPVAVHGEAVDGEVHVPLATTEGALLASINRGCAAIRAARGAQVHVEDVGMTRAPVFRTSGIRETRDFIRWVAEHEGEIRALTESTSRYLKLLDIRPYSFGTTVFLRFRFESGDAMGMNMATIACDRAVGELIEPSTGVRCVALSGNYCVDKKPAAINFQEGRGKRIHAEVLLEAPVLKKYLKTDARSLVEVQYRKNLLGSIAAGSQGFNAHIANVVAAYFVATGQDLAHVVGASMGVTSIEARGPDSVYASIYLPDLPVGAVGGGTALATQFQALELLGVRPDPDHPGKAAVRLAEILGAAVLAGELSLMAAFTSQDLARAHVQLGRGGDEAKKPERAPAVATSAPPQDQAVAGATFSTPGKLILAGEHAAVYGRPALVTAVDLRLEARITALPGDGPNLLELPQLGLKEEAGWDELAAYTREARKRWAAYQDRPGPETFARLQGDDPAHVVKVALGEAADWAGAGERPRFALRVNSDLPVGSGFGSSAATSVAVIAAYLAFAGSSADPDELQRLSLEVERRQHGAPSGIDTAAVLQGGLLWARRDLTGGFERESLPAVSPVLGKIRVFNSGDPRESTGAVVAAVRERADADPLHYQDLFDRMERATWSLRQELARELEKPARIIALIREYQTCLEALGVVPTAVQELVRAVEARGGGAKISGAGALSGTGAGSLLVYHPNPGQISTWKFLAGLSSYPVRLGAQGVRQEG